MDAKNLKPSEKKLKKNVKNVKRNEMFRKISYVQYI